MAKKKRTKADLEARQRLFENAERTRQLAEEAQARLERREQVGPSYRLDDQSPESRREARRRLFENAERTRRLAEKAQAELERRRQPQQK
jgi:hypothetical protein